MVKPIKGELVYGWTPSGPSWCHNMAPFREPYSIDNI